MMLRNILPIFMHVEDNKNLYCTNPNVLQAGVGKLSNKIVISVDKYFMMATTTCDKINPEVLKVF